MRAFDRDQRTGLRRLLQAGDETWAGYVRPVKVKALRRTGRDFSRVERSRDYRRTERMVTA